MTRPQKGQALLTALLAIAAPEDVAGFLERFGGERQYIPVLRTLERDERDKAVIQGFRERADYEALAERDGRSKRQIRRITGKGRPQAQ